MDKLETSCRAFLWSVSLNKRKALVSWEGVCKPVKCGGLGIKHVRWWNLGLLVKLVWDIALNKERLWIRWVHSYYSLDIRASSASSWVWKEILRARDALKDYISLQNGNLVWKLGTKRVGHFPRLVGGSCAGIMIFFLIMASYFGLPY